MDLRETLARVKPLMGAVAFVGMAGAWIVVLRSGGQDADWDGFWSSPSEVRGNVVNTKGKLVETPLEREKRLGLDKNHVNETLYQAKKSLLGERAKTLGENVGPDRGAL